MPKEPRPGTDPKLFRRFMEKVSVGEGCWKWTAATNRDGYGMIGVGRKGERSHRVSFRLFNGDIPAGLSVLHTCDNTGCVNPEHLYVGTQAQNVRDRVVRGRSRHPFGQDHGRAKLSSADVTEIRSQLAAGCVQRRLAERYGVTPTTILGIKRGRIRKKG
jgi:hypothetical protein